MTKNGMRLMSGGMVAALALLVAGGAVAEMKITMEPGWKMGDAISVEEVGAITGETMKAFPEAADSPSKGRPARGFTVDGKNMGKITFSALMEGGAEKFDIQKQYAEDGTLEELSGVGDKAYVLTTKFGDTRLVALVGDSLVKVFWTTEPWSKFDRAEFGSKLANTLIENITK